LYGLHRQLAAARNIIAALAPEMRLLADQSFPEAILQMGAIARRQYQRQLVRCNLDLREQWSRGLMDFLA
jgi:hypothetical protein